jgi:hypothetical protein
MDRDLDKWIAEHVMGWVRKTVRLGRSTDTGNVFFEAEALVFGDKLHALEQHLLPYNVGGLPHYSSDIAAAWQVVEKLREHNLTFDLRISPGTMWVVWITKLILIPFKEDKTLAEAKADTPSMAICLAAKKALEQSSQ